MMRGVIPNLVRSLELVIDIVGPGAPDDFWYNVMKAVISTRDDDACDMLFRFAKGDFPRYARIMREVLGETGAPDLLMEKLHEKLVSGGPGREAGEMVIFQRKMKKVAASFAYLKQFV
jgi:hypothetical protein